nr:SDR family NAD(P)-dependent oxidoreductase [Candidatus Freyarchaeota archaeon]
MTSEKEEDTRSSKKKSRKYASHKVAPKKADSRTASDRPKVAPEPVEVEGVKGRLLGKVALVTGGSSGIGQGIALRFAKEGAKVCFTYNTNLEGAKKVAKEIEIFGEVLYTQCDLKDEERVNKVVEETEANLGSINILVNNAGTYDYGKVGIRASDAGSSIISLVPDMTLEQWRNMFRVNVEGTFNFSRAVIKSMQKGDRIINMSSTAAFSGQVISSHYSAAKAAINGFTRTLALEVAHRGITVNAIAPGIIYTPMIMSYTKEFTPELYKEIPVGRYGKPEDIAGIAAYLASPEASYITGQVIVVDGGLTLFNPISRVPIKLMGL